MPSLDLLNEISQQLSLYKDQSESTEEWHGRVLYSALGKLSLASLWDSPDDWNHELSVQAFKSKIKTNTEYYQQIVNSNCLYVQKTEIDSFGRAYLWRHSGQVFEDSLKEIHLYIPETGFEPKRGGKTPLQPCYLDSRTGYIDFTDDSQNGKEGVLKLYYCGYSEKGRPDVITFPTCPHCKKRMGNAELTSFATRGNLSFFNLIKAQFDSEQPVKGKENKLHYPGSERRKDTRTRPARAFIDDENYKKRVVSCDECGWFGLREDDIKVCPFCGNRSLTESLPMLRPWGFAPKDAKEIPVADLDEQYSYVQQPLYSTLPESETMENVAGYKSLRMASRTNQRIIMVNKGAGGKGFMVCPDCGAAMPGDDPSVLEKVDRPYITVPKFKCSHRDAENLNLGYDFVTDMLVLEISLDPNKVETDREDNLWVNRAGQSLSETIRLVVSRILDVEFTELMTGYRVRKNQTGAYIDVYIYDSLSSGAGYAVAVASVMPEVLERAEALLQGCDCENACYNCLKHYRNQNVHGMLDRFAALDLLNWAKDNSLAPMLSIDMQKKLLAPLGNVLKYADIILSANGDELSVKKNLFHKALKIYPAMWKKPEAKDTIYISDACVKYAKPSAVKKIIDGL